MDNIIIIGAGGHSKVVQDIVRSLNQYKIYAILDDAFSTTVEKEGIIYSSIHYLRKLNVNNYYFVIAIGDNRVRQNIAKRISIPSSQYATLIHPSVVISESSNIAKGTVVMPNAVINAHSNIGQHCIINSNAVVEHDNFLEDLVHISPGVVLSGGVKVGEGSHIGSGSVTIPNIKIGSWSTIGAGAVVIKNIPKYVTAVGVPAKIIKE